MPGCLEKRLFFGNNGKEAVSSGLGQLLSYSQQLQTYLEDDDVKNHGAKPKEDLSSVSQGQLSSPRRLAVASPLTPRPRPCPPFPHSPGWRTSQLLLDISNDVLICNWTAGGKT